MASGIKQNETRSWPTSYRGDLVICSAKRKPKLSEVGPEDYQGAISLPYGFALCIVEVVDCVSTDMLVLRNLGSAEYELGNYGRGRYAWITRNCRKLKVPVPIKGQQGFWNLSPELTVQILGYV